LEGALVVTGLGTELAAAGGLAGEAAAPVVCVDAGVVIGVDVAPTGGADVAGAGGVESVGLPVVPEGVDKPCVASDADALADGLLAPDPSHPKP
jgi:hypothetical protein